MTIKKKGPERQKMAISVALKLLKIVGDRVARH